MKRFYFSIIFSIVVSLLFGQDAIYKKDNTKIDGKVLEVGISEIKYKLASNPDGPIYSISKSEVALITYQNGSHEVASSVAYSSLTKIDSVSVRFCRNFIGIDVSEFATTSIGTVYEHTFGKKGIFAFRLSLSTGMEHGYTGYPQGKIFGSGLDILYFPVGQRVLSYYVAPYFEYAVFNNYKYYYYTRDYGNHIAGGIKNGILYQPVRHFSFSADFGLGIKQDETYDYNYSNKIIQPHITGNVIIGYRF